MCRAVEVTPSEINPVASATSVSQGLYSSQQALTALHVVPSSFMTELNAKIRADTLGTDTRVGVTMKGPEGVPTTGSHRTVVLPKPNVKPRRAVDLSALNKSCKRETHSVVPPYIQAWLVPAHSGKTVTDTWGGYHSAMIREEDKHSPTFVTEWGRHSYRVATQGYSYNNDGYSKDMELS